MAGRRIKVAAVSALAAVAVVGCGPSSPGVAPGPTVTLGPSGGPSVGSPVAPPTATAEPGDGRVQQWPMPDLVGMSLQAAQDAMQAATGNPAFVTLSHDATGRGRQQVVDANWKVCSQNVAPGESVTLQSKIDFGAVKTDESCP